MNFVNLEKLPKELLPYIEKVQKSKTPLSILSSILELIEKEKTLPKEVQEQVRKEFNKVPINIIMDEK